MKITSIIENTSNRGLPVEHGLSLYIEKDDGQKVLFDMGQSTMYVRNAEALGLSIADIDIAVISHGHYDHGGGLKTFFQENSKADVYIHKDAFQPHYSLRETRLRFIGIDNDLSNHERIVFCDNQTAINDHLTLFADVQDNCCYPFGNRLLYGPAETENDDFRHEQNLLIEENGKLLLFAGCAHRGIVNIMRKAEEVAGKAPTHVFAGMHLVKSGLSMSEEDEFIGSLASELMKYGNTKFYTMHCTGEEQYLKLKSLMGSQIEYLSCGDRVTIL